MHPFTTWRPSSETETMAIGTCSDAATMRAMRSYDSSGGTPRRNSMAWPVGAAAWATSMRVRSTGPLTRGAGVGGRLPWSESVTGGGDAGGGLRLPGPTGRHHEKSIGNLPPGLDGSITYG
jgi:hypothetical protein